MSEGGGIKLGPEGKVKYGSGSKSVIFDDEMKDAEWAAKNF